MNCPICNSKVSIYQLPPKGKYGRCDNSACIYRTAPHHSCEDTNSYILADLAKWTAFNGNTGAKTSIIETASTKAINKAVKMQSTRKVILSDILNTLWSIKGFGSFMWQSNGFLNIWHDFCLVNIPNAGQDFAICQANQIRKLKQKFDLIRKTDNGIELFLNGQSVMVVPDTYYELAELDDMPSAEWQSKVVKSYELPLSEIYQAQSIGAPKDDPRKYLNGIYINGKTSDIVATDGHILYIRAIETGVDFDIIIHNNFINFCRKFKSDNAKIIQINYIDEDTGKTTIKNYGSIKIGEYEIMYLQQIDVDRDYPNYEIVIPSEFVQTLEYSAQELTQIANLTPFGGEYNEKDALRMVVNSNGKIYGVGNVECKGFDAEFLVDANHLKRLASLNSKAKISISGTETPFLCELDHITRVIIMPIDTNHLDSDDLRKKYRLPVEIQAQENDVD